jgi:hypothetical protein
LAAPEVRRDLRLVFKHVQRGTGPARDVDKRAFSAKRAQHIAVDEMTGFGPAGGVTTRKSLIVGSACKSATKR